MFRTVASLLVIVGLVGACGGVPPGSVPARTTAPATPAATAPTATPDPPAGPTGSAPSPASSPGPTATPVSTAPSPTPTLEPIRGWPAVERDGVSLSGRRLDTVEFGRLRFAVVVEGLDPGTTVTLRARGRYEVRWACGVEPEPCGEVGCAPTAWTTTEGTTTATVRATAGPDGTATVRVRLVATPPTRACRGDPGAPWGGWEHAWSRLRIADRTHGLTLAPGRIYEGDTI